MNRRKNMFEWRGASFFETSCERLEAKGKNVKVQNWESLGNRINELLAKGNLGNTSFINEEVGNGREDAEPR